MGVVRAPVAIREILVKSCINLEIFAGFDARLDIATGARTTLPLETPEMT